MFKCLLSPACYCSVGSRGLSREEKWSGEVCMLCQHQQPGPAATSRQFNEPGDAWSAAWRAAWRPVCLCSKAPTEAWASFPCSFTGRLHRGDSVVLTSAHSPIWFNVGALAKNWYLFENYHCNVYLLIGPRHDCQVSGEFVIRQKGWDGTNNDILVVETKEVW